MELVGTLFSFVGGLGMFIYGMNTMADGLQKAAGNKTKKLMNFLTKNRLMAVLVGALITAIIQSSSATTVMVVGFVNARFMDLTQAVGVIMGANIGTTITAWLVSMSEWGDMLKPEFYAPLFIGIGAFVLMFTKKESLKEKGAILIGFGFLFVGLSLMSGAIEPYRNSPVFADAFRVLGKNPLLGILTGMVVTAVIQSSSASVGILQTLAIHGVVNWNSAIFITLGQNIGTCVTALLSSAGTNRTAKRAATIHLLFNTLGAGFFGILMFVLFQFNPGWGSSTINSVEISIFHTIFNITCTLLLFPFANTLVKLSGVIVKSHEEEPAASPVDELIGKLDQRILENPAFAIQTASAQVYTMGHLALENVRSATTALLNNNENEISKVFSREDVINQYEKLLTEYLVQIDSTSLTEKQHTNIKNLLYIISDMERISDHCENIAELSQNKIKQQCHFSIDGGKDLKIIFECAILSLENSLKAIEDSDSNAVGVTNFYENKVDEIEKKLREKHIRRLSTGECNTSSGIIFLDVLSNIERISDHAKNIANYEF